MWYMQTQDLELEELLDYKPIGSGIRFVGQRALLFDSVAQGFLRIELIASLGVEGARGVLGRFGYAHGRRMAEALRRHYRWDSDADLQRAGSRIYALQGLFKLEGEGGDYIDQTGGGWHDSYEAEQHVQHLGRSDYPVCWTLCGLVSGYLSRATGRDLFAIEDRCTGKGDADCHILLETARRFEEAKLGSQRSERKTAPAARILEPPDAIIARSPGMRRVMELARLVARVDSTVLITGESGTGKERVARFVHEQSPRADAPFVAINCGAISETLLESELFGHARGAFTGATSDRAGLFEAANGGTLFLDEVGELPPGMQVKLLRTLQEREVRRVGENASRPINVRILAATNRDLGIAVVEKRFRDDLYYRLKVMELAVPPLRDRREDILPLARALLAEASLRMRRSVEGLSGALVDYLLTYRWPGNVRELANVMERGVAVTTKNRLEIEDLPQEIRPDGSLEPASGGIRRLDSIEKEYILAILKLKQGNRKQTSQALGIGVATLHRKLKAYKKEASAEAAAPRPRRRSTDSQARSP
jgi:two-component system response regulator HydG